MKNADLSDTNMTGVYLSNANLSGADFTNADLIATDLTNSDLTDANFKNTYMNHANLSGANLKQAINLTQDQIETTFINKETLLPDSIPIVWVSDTEYEFGNT